jgi:hypothetical protein
MAGILFEEVAGPITEKLEALQREIENLRMSQTVTQMDTVKDEPVQVVGFSDNSKPGGICGLIRRWLKIDWLLSRIIPKVLFPAKVSHIFNMASDSPQRIQSQ